MKVVLEEALACVGPGWHGLVRVLYQALPADAQVVQVKEKFGRLTFYWRDEGQDYGACGSDTGYQRLVALLEDASGQICEICGALGATKGPGWLKTYCEEHYEERNKEKNQA
jgi:hypothetical protein